MKKNNSIIILSENEKIIINFSKKTKDKIILLNKDIFNLEKITKNNKKFIIYPIKFNENNYEKEKLIFLELIKKNLNDINKIIIDTQTPKYAKTLQNMNYEEFINSLKNDIENILALLNFFLNQKNYIKVLVLIHKEKNEKNNFFTIKSCINKFLIELMNNINMNNINININCVSTENIKLDYKKHIYPFKKNKSLKPISDLVKICNFILKNEIKNKIIIS